MTLTRTQDLRRKKPMRRDTPVKKSNRKRRQTEFARCYGSRERVAWVKAQPCAFCRLRGLVRIPTESDNAHTETDGMGRKAGYETIVPLCRRHHEQYDRHLPPFNRASVRYAIRALAQKTQAEWAGRSTPRGMD